MGNMHTTLKLLLGATALTAITTGTAFADGTAAGTSVDNAFVLTYDVGGTPQTPIDTTDGVGGTDTPTSFTVDRFVDLTVTGGDTTNVAPGSVDQELVFSVTNVGNGDQSYTLTPGVVGGGDFGVTGLNVKYYFESGDTVGFDADDLAGTEYVYTAGTSTETLPVDAIIWVVVDGDIDGAAAVTESTDIYLIADTVVAANNGDATTAVENDTDGNILTGAGSEENVLGDAAGTDDVATDGDHSARGTYLVEIPNLAATKAVTIFDQDATEADCRNMAGTAPAGDQYSIPGACVEYVITVVNSSATLAIDDIDLTDILPADLTYEGAAMSGDFTGGTLSNPTLGADCDLTVCTVSIADAVLQAGETGYLTIRTFLK